ncbi:hypothetical protein Tco_0480792 [Tanacetum coccineum]
MIGREILGSFCVNYFEFEFLKEENPPEQSRLGIFFSKEIFEGGVIRIHNAFVQDEPTRLWLMVKAVENPFTWLTVYQKLDGTQLTNDSRSKKLNWLLVHQGDTMIPPKD